MELKDVMLTDAEMKACYPDRPICNQNVFSCDECSGNCKAIAQAQLAKLQPYIEAERERAVKEYRAKVETILVNYADTVSESNAGSVYYLNGRSVDEYLDLIDRAEIKQGSNQ
jgi:hypothetical protein